MMNYYLLDLENVHRHGFFGIESLSGKDHIIVFYSDCADSIAIDLHFKINASPAKVEFRRAYVGPKNALDFQLSSHLGYLISHASRWKKTAAFYIVSNDLGYNVLIDYWKEFGVSVYQVANLAKEPVNQASQEENPAGQEAPACLAKAVLDIVKDKDYASNIISFAGRAEDANALNVFLTRMFNDDTPKAGEIYRAVKKAIGNPSLAIAAIDSLG